MPPHKHTALRSDINNTVVEFIFRLEKRLELF